MRANIKPMYFNNVSFPLKTYSRTPTTNAMPNNIVVNIVNPIIDIIIVFIIINMFLIILLIGGG